MWKDLYGCNEVLESLAWSDATTTCTSLCGGRKESLQVCGMKDVGHDLNTPFQGYPFGVAWDFLSAHSKPDANEAKPAAEAKPEAKPAPAEKPKPAPKSSTPTSPSPSAKEIV